MPEKLELHRSQSHELFCYHNNNQVTYLSVEVTLILINANVNGNNQRYTYTEYNINFKLAGYSICDTFISLNSTLALLDSFIQGKVIANNKMKIIISTQPLYELYIYCCHRGNKSTEMEICVVSQNEDPDICKNRQYMHFGYVKALRNAISKVISLYHLEPIIHFQKEDNGDYFYEKNKFRSTDKIW
jgi:hypothetical protein